MDEDYWKNLEREHKKSLSMTIEDELKAFPEAISALKHNKFIYDTLITEFKKELVEVIKKSKKKHSNDQISIIVILNTLLRKDIREVQENLKFINRYLLKINQMKKGNLNYYTEKLRIAKETDVEAIITKLGLELGKADFISCPFLVEKTPSLKAYRKSKTFKCYSCGFQGDNIAFVKKYLNIGFIEAIDFIVN